MAEAWNPGGSFHPEPTGLELRFEDCPTCNLPTLVGLTAYDREPLRVDALPLRAWREGCGAAGAGVLHGAEGFFYAEHICPIWGNHG